MLPCFAILTVSLPRRFSHSSHSSWVPTPFEQTTYPTRPDTRRYEKIVRFATIGPVKAGWLMKDRGRWSLTDEGRSIFKRFSDLEQFTKEADRLYRQWRRAQPAEEEVPSGRGPPLKAATTLRRG